MTNSGNQPSRSLLCDIMMYKNKDISTIPAIQWGLKHEATALSASQKNRLLMSDIFCYFFPNNIKMR
jgi:hypothetical protein